MHFGFTVTACDLAWGRRLQAILEESFLERQLPAYAVACTSVGVNVLCVSTDIPYILCMCVCTDGWMDGWMGGCVDAWMYAWMYACMYVCMYARMYVCMCVCMYVYICR